jgi:beta-lactamase class A
MVAPGELEAALRARIACFSGHVALCAIRLDQQQRIDIDSELPLPIASTGKLFLLLTLMSQVDSGNRHLLERIELGEHRTLGSGVLLQLDAGLRPTLWDLAALMQMVSDNTAANLLLAELGLPAVHRELQRAGLRHSELRGAIDFAAVARDQRAFAVSTAAELATLLLRLRRGELLSKALTARSFELLRVQKYIEPLRRLLPADPYAREFGEPEPVWVASKTGSLRGLRTESGLVHARGVEWVISVITTGSRDGRVTSDHEGWRLVSETSRLVYDAWAPAE